MTINKYCIVYPGMYRPLLQKTRHEHPFVFGRLSPSIGVKSDVLYLAYDSTSMMSAIGAEDT